MTKAGLTDAVYRVHGGLSRREAGRIVDRILERMKRALAEEGQVRIAGFGRLEVVSRRPRSGRNPHTGQRLAIPGRRTIVLRPAGTLLHRLSEAASRGETP